MNFALVRFFEAYIIFLVYLPLVDKSVSRLFNDLMSVLNCIIFGLQGKSFKILNNDYFLFSLFDYFSFSTFEIVFLAGIVQLVCWSGTLVLFFIQFFYRILGSCPAMFFNSSSPLMILATFDFFNFSDFYCFAVKICVRDVICSAIRSIA